jgi:hypothetical protein
MTRSADVIIRLPIAEAAFRNVYGQDGNSPAGDLRLREQLLEKADVSPVL